MSQPNDFEKLPAEENNKEENIAEENSAEENKDEISLENPELAEEKSDKNSIEDNVTEDIVVNDDSEEVKPKKKKKKKSKIKKILLWILIVFLVLILSGIITLFILIQKGKSSLLNIDGMNLDPGDVISNLEVEDNGKTIEYNGKKYTYNDNMTAILCIGVDKESISDEIGLNGSNGQADALFLYAMDTSNGKSTVIPISRDTMVDVDMYSGDGKYISSSKKQICLSYAYGDGQKQSCRNTVKSVSRLFYGLPINSYVAIDLKAIEELSKNIGGVTVVPNEDFEYSGYSFYKGKKTTLSGVEARVYVKGRDQSKLDSNLNRMARQKEFINAYFSKAVTKTKEKITFPINVYNTAKGYMLTDIDVSEVSFLASCVVMNDVGLQYKSIKGEMKMGDKYAEYYADDESVYNIIVDVFYNPVS